MDIIRKVFDFMGSLICHQLPSRTLWVGSDLLPVCARDTGIYTGIFTGAAFLLLMRRYKSNKPPGIKIAIVMCVLMLPMIFDGLMSYLGFIETNNLTRLLTGVLFGLPITFFLVPLAHFDVYTVNDKVVLKSIGELTLAYLIALSLCFMQYKSIIPYFAAGSIFVSGFLFLISRIVYTVLTRLGWFKKSKLYVMTGFITICIILFMFFISWTILQPLKKLLPAGGALHGACLQ